MLKTREIGGAKITRGRRTLNSRWGAFTDSRVLHVPTAGSPRQGRRFRLDLQEEQSNEENGGLRATARRQNVVLL